MRPYIEKRVQYRRDFVDSVAPVDVRGDPDAVAVCYKSVVAAQRQLWKLRWDNHFKEVLWRLVVNGLATAERMHMQDNDCVCVALWSEVNLADATTSGIALLPRLLWPSCNNSS
jgi:hypothetical protein